MPYNPGVVDVSGQIRAAASERGTNAFVQGMSQGIAKWEKNKEEDKMMQGIIKSAEMMAKGFGEVANSVSPELGSAVQKMQEAMSDPNKSTRERAMAADAFTKGISSLMGAGMDGMKMKAQQEQQKQANMAAAAKAQAEAEKESRAQRIAAAAGAIPNGLPLPKGLTQDEYSEATAKVPGIQAQMGQVAAQMQQAQNTSEDRTVDKLAARVAAGRPITGPYRGDIIDRANLKGAQAIPSTIYNVRGTNAQGGIVQNTYGMGGSLISSAPIQPPPRGPLTPQEQGAAKAQEVLQTSDAQSVVGFEAASREAAPLLAQYRRASELLNNPETKTGIGMPVVNNLKRIYVQLGGDEKTANTVADFGELNNLLSNQVISYIAKTKGAVSDREMQTFMDYSANPNKTPEENKRIIGFTIKLLERQQAIGSMVGKMRKEKTDPLDIVQAVNTYIEENPLDLAPTPKAGGAQAAGSIFEQADAILRGSR